MALTQEFKESVAARLQRDPRFLVALFTEAINAYLSGETAAGKAMLRDIVNATPRPSSAFVSALQKKAHVKNPCHSESRVSRAETQFLWTRAKLRGGQR